MHTPRITTILACFFGSISLGALGACSVSVDAELGSTPWIYHDIGAVCAFGSQCESGQCSADESSGACGVCLDVRKLGERCDGPLQGCSASAICQDGVCVSTKSIIGEPCELGAKGSDAGDCDDELFCAGDSGLKGMCQAFTPVGGACGTSSSRCVPGAHCSDSNVCTTQPTAWTCSDSDCGDGLSCDNTGTCRAPTLPMGAPCGIVNGSFVDGNCVAGSVCGSVTYPDGGGGPNTSSACVALPEAGEVCIREQCAEGLFCSEQTTNSSGVVPRRCDPLRAEGEACSRDYIFHKDCAAGLECRKDVCQQACR